MRTAAFFAITLGVASALHLRPAKSNAAAPAETGPIFYTVAMDKLASKHQTRLWLSSVRKVGQWKGEVVIVTDHPDCLAKNLDGLLGGPKMAHSTDKMDVFPGGEGMGKVFIMRQPTTGKVKAMKQEKALAFKNMETLGLKPSFIVYTDQDIVFGKDVNIVVDDAKKNLQGQGHTLALFIDQGVTKGQLHTGIILLFPGEATDKCLAEWGTKILSTHASKYKGFDKHVDVSNVGFGRVAEEAGLMLEAEAMGPDQRALGKTASCKAGKGIAILDKEHLMMPTSGKLGGKATATFIHFTNTNRWKSIKNEVMKQYFTTVLGLPEQEWFEYEQCAASAPETWPPSSR